MLVLVAAGGARFNKERADGAAFVVQRSVTLFLIYKLHSNWFRLLNNGSISGDDADTF